MAYNHIVRKSGGGKQSRDVNIFPGSLYLTPHFLSPVAHTHLADLRVDRETSGSRYSQARVARSRCSPTRTPADKWKACVTAGWHPALALPQKTQKNPNGHLSIVHQGQRRGLAADDADGQLVLQAAGNPARRGLVRRGAGTHLAAVVVAPRVHLEDKVATSSRQRAELKVWRPIDLSHEIPLKYTEICSCVEKNFRGFESFQSNVQSKECEKFCFYAKVQLLL